MHCLDGLSPTAHWPESCNINQEEDDATFTGIELVSLRQTYTPTYPINLLKLAASHFALLGHNPTEFTPLCKRVAELDDSNLDIEFVPLFIPFVVAMHLAEKKHPLRVIYKSLKKGAFRNYLYKRVKKQYWYDRDGVRHVKLNTRRLEALYQGMAWTRGQLNPSNYQEMAREWRKLEFQGLAAHAVVAEYNHQIDRDENGALWGVASLGLLLLGSALFPMSETVVGLGASMAMFGGWKGKVWVSKQIESWLMNRGLLASLTQPATNTPLLKSRYQFYQSSTGLGGRLLGKQSRSSGILHVGHQQIPFKASTASPFPIPQEYLSVLRGLLLKEVDEGRMSLQECKDELIPYTVTPLIYDGQILVSGMISQHEINANIIPLLEKHPHEVSNWNLYKEKIP